MGAVRGPTKILLLAIAVVGLALPASPQNAPASPQSATRQHTPPPPEARVDINHASADELMKVPGMTRTWADRIVRFRPYRTKQDLVDRGVLTTEVYDRIKDSVIAHRNKQ
jgi:competence protein ComEA